MSISVKKWSGTRKPGISRRQKSDLLTAIVFLAPSLIGFLIFVLVPAVTGFAISFTDWNLLSQPKWVGLENYRIAFQDDPLFWLSLKNTLVYSVIVIFGGLPVSLLLALAVNSKLKLIELFRTIYFVPVVCSIISASLVWKWIFHPELGILNSILKLFGLPMVSWLGNPHTALFSVAIVSIWLNMGYNMVIFLAGLKGIPSHLYEAAAMDGAVGIKAFRYITLPLLTPTIFFVMVMSIIGSFQVFGQVYVMTINAGPGNATLVYVYYMWQNAFNWFKMGYASALAYILFAIILVVTLIQFRFLGGQVHYEVN